MTYVGAPYNFVSFPEKVIVAYDQDDQLPRHDRYVEGMLTGHIHYTLKAETPIMIADGNKNINKQFMKNAKGDHIIPGNTIRGLLRTAVQVFGQSDMSADIEEQRFLYRMLTTDNKKLNIEYKNRIGVATVAKLGKATKETKSVLENLKAGYIKKVGKDEYVIIPAKKDETGRQHYLIKEFELRRMSKISTLSHQIKWMYTNNILDHVHLRREPGLRAWYQKLKQPNVRIARQAGSPYMVDQISYSFDSENDRISDVAKDGLLKYTGALLCSGFMQKKIAHYIVREADTEAAPIKIKKEYIEEYERDLRVKKYNKDDKSYYHLPKDEKPKPIFYVENDNRLDFGYTPYLRIFYKHSVKEGIPEAAKLDFKKGIDFAQALFGYAMNENKTAHSYRGRVSFSDGVCRNGNLLEKQLMMLSEPKATCYPLYLKQDEGSLMSYNNTGFQLRGIKQYWLNQDHNPKAAYKRDGKPRKSNTTFTPLDRGATFTGIIHFTNVSEEELGLLLWALNQDDKCFHHIGMGKPYGFGRVSVAEVSVSVKKLGEWYDSFDIAEKEVYETKNVAACISLYKEDVKSRFGIEVSDAANVREWIAMKSNLQSHETTRYMEIEHLSGGKDKWGPAKEYKELLEDGKGYSNRFPTVEEVTNPEAKRKMGQRQANLAQKNLSGTNKTDSRKNNHTKVKNKKNEGHS